MGNPGEIWRTALIDYYKKGLSTLRSSSGLKSLDCPEMRLLTPTQRSKYQNLKPKMRSNLRGRCSSTHLNFRRVYKQHGSAEILKGLRCRGHSLSYPGHGICPQ